MRYLRKFFAIVGTLLNADRHDESRHAVAMGGNATWVMLHPREKKPEGQEP
jgi:hypothetical protein